MRDAFRGMLNRTAGNRGGPSTGSPDDKPPTSTGSSPCRRRTVSGVKALGLAAAVVLLATACSQTADQGQEDNGGSGYPTGHIHGLAVDPGTQELLLATHDGLFNLSADPIEKISPTIDLMGFALADAGNYYASGHPGPGVDLPNPVGLIQSEDGGETWEPLSRQGESDFHAMAATSEGIVGFDGELRITTDLENWSTAKTPLRPVSLAATPSGPVVLGATEQGVQRSVDGGDTWSLVPDPPLLQFLAFADEDTAVGVAPDGTVQLSDDAGVTWEKTGKAGAEPAAVAADATEEGVLKIWVATANGIEYSEDGGKTFTTTVRASQQ